MVQHKPWKFFSIRFTADDKKHVVSVGAADEEDAIELIKDMYSNVRALRVTQRVEE
jgi:1,2-phenylacetyl-CoA epoxidase PaaB subunit